MKKGALKKAGLLLLSAMVCLAAWASPAAADETSVRKVLAKADIFKGLSAGQLDRVAALAKLQKLKSGEKFIQHGRNMERIFVLASGRAKVVLKSGEVAVQVGPGTTLGEMELADGMPASATVQMDGPGSAVVIEMHALRKTMAADPKLGYLVMSGVARKISGQLRQRN